MKRLPLILALLMVAAMLPAPGNAPLIVDSRVWVRLQAPEQTQIDIRVMLLQKTFERMVSCDCYRPHDGRTFCNIACFDAIDDRPGSWRGYGYMLADLSLDVSMLFSTAGSIMMCSPAELYRRVDFAERRGRVETVSMYHAWELSRAGEVVMIVSARYNHVALCFPDCRPYIRERGVRVANVGRFNCITDISHRFIFGKCYQDKEIKFVHLQRRGA